MTESLEEALQRGGVIKSLKGIAKSVGQKIKSLGTISKVTKRPQGKPTVRKPIVLDRTLPLKTVKDKTIARQQVAASKRAARTQRTQSRVAAKVRGIAKQAQARKAAPVRKAIRKAAPRTKDQKMAAVRARRLTMTKKLSAKATSVKNATRKLQEERVKKMRGLTDIKKTIKLNALMEERRAGQIPSARNRARIQLIDGANLHKVTVGPYGASKKTVTDLSISTKTNNDINVELTGKRDPLRVIVKRETISQAGHEAQRTGAYKAEMAGRSVADSARLRLSDAEFKRDKVGAARKNAITGRDDAMNLISKNTTEISYNRMVAERSKRTAGEMDAGRISSQSVKNNRDVDLTNDSMGREANFQVVKNYSDQQAGAIRRRDTASTGLASAGSSHDAYIKGLQSNSGAQVTRLKGSLADLTAQNATQKGNMGARRGAREGAELAVASNAGKISTTIVTRNAQIKTEITSKILYDSAAERSVLNRGELTALESTTPTVKAPRDAALARAEAVRPVLDTENKARGIRKIYIETTGIPAERNRKLTAQGEYDRIKRFIDMPGGLLARKQIIDGDLNGILPQRRSMRDRRAELEVRQLDALKTHNLSVNERGIINRNLASTSALNLRHTQHMDAVQNMINSKITGGTKGYTPIFPQVEDIFITGKRASASDAGRMAAQAAPPIRSKIGETQGSIIQKSILMQPTLAMQGSFMKVKGDLTEKIVRESAATQRHTNARAGASGRIADFRRNGDLSKMYANTALANRYGMLKNIDAGIAKRDAKMGEISASRFGIRVKNDLAIASDATARRLRFGRTREEVQMLRRKSEMDAADLGRRQAAGDASAYERERTGALAREQTAKGGIANSMNDTNSIISSMNNNPAGTTAKYKGDLATHRASLADIDGLIVSRRGRREAQEKLAATNKADIDGVDPKIQKARTDEINAKDANDDTVKSMKENEAKLNDLKKDVPGMKDQRDTAEIAAEAKRPPPGSRADEPGLLKKRADNEAALKKKVAEHDAEKSIKDDLEGKRDVANKTKDPIDKSLEQNLKDKADADKRKKELDERKKDEDATLEETTRLKDEADADIQKQKKSLFSKMHSSDLALNLLSLVGLMGLAAAAGITPDENALIPAMFGPTGLVDETASGAVTTALYSSRAGVSGATVQSMPGQVLTGDAEYDAGYAQGARDGIAEATRDGTTDGIIAFTTKAGIGDASTQKLQTDRIAAMKPESIANFQNQMKKSKLRSYCKQVQLQSVGMKIDINKKYPQCRAIFAEKPMNLTGETVTEYGDDEYADDEYAENDQYAENDEYADDEYADDEYGDEYGYSAEESLGPNGGTVQQGGFVNPTEEYDLGYTAGYASTYADYYDKAYIIARLQGVAAVIQGRTFSGTIPVGASGSLRPKHKRIIKVYGEDGYEYADNADNADNAEYADNADYGDYADDDYGDYGDYSDYADYADYANNTTATTAGQLGGSAAKAAAALKRGNTLRQHAQLLKRVGDKTISAK